AARLEERALEHLKTVRAFEAAGIDLRCVLVVTIGAAPAAEPAPLEAEAAALRRRDIERVQLAVDPHRGDPPRLVRQHPRRHAARRCYFHAPEVVHLTRPRVLRLR